MHQFHLNGQVLFCFFIIIHIYVVFSETSSWERISETKQEALLLTDELNINAFKIMSCQHCEINIYAHG